MSSFEKQSKLKDGTALGFPWHLVSSSESKKGKGSVSASASGLLNVLLHSWELQIHT